MRSKVHPCEAGSPPHPLRQSRNSLPTGRHGPPQGPCQLAANAGHNPTWVHIFIQAIKRCRKHLRLVPRLIPY